MTVKKREEAQLVVKKRFLSISLIHREKRYLTHEYTNRMNLVAATHHSGGSEGEQRR